MNVYDGMSPCQECADRKVGCHSTCPKYTEWKATAVKQPQRDFYEIRSYRKRRKK